MKIEERDRTRLLWLCGALHAFTHLYTVALLPLYLLIKRDLHLASDGQVTFLMTTFWFSYCLASYPLGVLADRLNRKTLLTVGLALNGVGFIGLASAPSYSWAVAWSALAGLGGSFYHPSATAMLADLYPLETGKALGRVGSGAAIGFWIGPAYAGWRGGTAGWRAPVMELGVFGIIAALLFAWFAPSMHRVHEHGHGANPSTPLGAGRPNDGRSSTGFWVLMIVVSLLFSLRDFGGAGMSTLASLFLQYAWLFSPSSTGQILGGMLLVAIISNPLFGALSDRFRLQSTCAVLGIAAVMVAIMPWLPRAFVVAGLIGYGFFFLANYPIVEAALMESVPARIRGKAFGLFISVSGVIASLSHWIIGDRVHVLKSHHPHAYAPLFGTLALLIIISLAGVFLLGVMRKRFISERR